MFFRLKLKVITLLVAEFKIGESAEYEAVLLFGDSWSGEAVEHEGVPK